jgi:hypothetical protein
MRNSSGAAAVRRAARVVTMAPVAHQCAHPGGDCGIRAGDAAGVRVPLRVAQACRPLGRGVGHAPRALVPAGPRGPVHVDTRRDAAASNLAPCGGDDADLRATAGPDRACGRGTMSSSIRPRIVTARCKGLSMSPFRQAAPDTASPHPGRSSAESELPAGGKRRVFVVCAWRTGTSVRRPSSHAS